MAYTATATSASFYPQGTITWVSNTTSPYNHLAQEAVDRHNKEIMKAQALDEAREEMDNLLEDYLEELRALDEDAIDPKEVVKVLQSIQEKVAESIYGPRRDSYPDVDADIREMRPVVVGIDPTTGQVIEELR